MASSVTRLGELRGPMKLDQEPKPRDESWGNELLGSSESYQTSDNGSWWSLSSTIVPKLSWIKNTPVSKGQSSTTRPSLIDNTFFLTLQSIDRASDTLINANEWYRQFLTEKILQAWPLVARTVLGTSQNAFDLEIVNRGEKAITMVLCNVTQAMAKRDLALVEIVDDLYNCELLKETSMERTEGNQLVFAIVGWLSMLYEPEKDAGCWLRIQIPSSEIFDDQRLQHLRIENKFTSPCRQSMDNIDLPLHMFLRHFGNLIPERQLESFDTLHLREQNSYGQLPQYSADRHESWIDLSLVCFHTLHRVAGIKIKWVDTLPLHLDFDSRTKVLSIFKFPSFAFLMCHSESTTVLSRLLIDLRTDSESEEDAKHFFTEVLLSYRLIFGQTRSSRKDFNRIYSKSSFWSKQSNPDPLITVLCGQSCESEDSRRVYDEIEADDPSNHYDPAHDFPFLGKRLLELQDYVRGRNPNNIVALWYDRRNVSWWWTFWAVIFIGGFGLLLALVQTVFQILQLVQGAQNPTEDHDSPIGNPLIGVPGEAEGSIDDFKTPFSSIFALILFVLAITILFIAVFWPWLKGLLGSCQKEIVPMGRCRVHWKCHCGQNLQDDFLELRPEAAEELARSMEAEQSVPITDASNTQSVDIESQSTSSFSDSSSSITLSKMSSWFSFRIRSPKDLDTERIELPKSQGKDCDSTEPNEPRYLLVCVGKSDGSIGLLQMDVSGISSDRVLLSHIREKYLKIRGKWLPLFSMRSLQAINFVQFELWPSGDVEVKQYFDYKMLPHGAKTEDYSYQKPETFPPIGPGKLMHLWNTPGHLDGNGLTCLSRFPKKKRERLHVGPSGDPADGWGIHLVDGFNWVLISVLIISIALIGSLVFGVSFALLHHDIQSSFAIASYVISFAAFSVGGCSICSRRIKSTPSSLE